MNISLRDIVYYGLIDRYKDDMGDEKELVKLFAETLEENDVLSDVKWTREDFIKFMNNETDKTMPLPLMGTLFRVLKISDEKIDYLRKEYNLGELK